MTPEEFQALYRPTEALTDQGIRSYRARPTTGGEVFCHVFAGIPEEDGERLLRLVEELPPDERAKVLSTLEVDGLTVVVTEVLEGFDGLDSWLTSRSASAASQAPEPDPAVLGEFASLFGVPTEVGDAPGTSEPGRSGTVPPPTREMPAVAPPPSTAAPPTGTQGSPDQGRIEPDVTPPPPSGGSEPGEFTRLFGASDGEVPPPAAPTPTPAPLGAEPPTAPPPVPPDDSPPPPPAGGDAPVSASEPGEFTRLFGAADGPRPTAGATPDPGPPEIVPPPAAAPTPSPEVPTSPPEKAPPAQPGGSEPGEFTRLFGASGASGGTGTSEGPPVAPVVPPPAPPVVPPPVPPAVVTPPPAMPVPPPAPPPKETSPGLPGGSAQAPGGSEPGEFTRLFGAAETPPSTGGPGAAPKSPAPGPVSPPSPPTREVPPDPSGPSEPGEFTRLFGTSDSTPPPAPPYGHAPSETQTPPPPGAAPPGSPPGEFTQLFGAPAPAPPSGGSSPLLPPGGAPTGGLGSGGEAWEERLRGGGGPAKPGAGTGPQYREGLAGSQPPPAPPAAPVPGIAPPDLPTGPGAYTRVVSATPPPPEVPAAETPAATVPEPTKGRRRSDWIILSVILAVVLIAATLIVVFVLRSAGGEPPSPQETEVQVSAYSAGRMITSSSFALGNAEGT